MIFDSTPSQAKLKKEGEGYNEGDGRVWVVISQACLLVACGCSILIG